MNWLLLCSMLALAAVSLLSLRLYERMNARWMRLFSEKQGIPAAMVDGKPMPEKPPAEVIDNRKRVSVPIPGVFRKVK